MTAEEKAQLHVVLLQALRAKGDFGRTESALLNATRMAGGFDIDLAALQVELRALANEKKWIIAMELDLGPKRWCITAIGARKLAEAGL